MLSEREQKILEYIETKMELDGIPPTIREICSDLQIKSTSTAHKEVNRLIEEGYLVKRRNKNRDKPQASNAATATDAPILSHHTRCWVW